MNTFVYFSESLFIFQNLFWTKLSRKFSKLAEVDELDPDLFDDLIVAQISILTSENLQSDERFVESFINDRKSQGKGPLRIRQELEQRKVSSDLVAEYLDEDNEQWQELAKDVYSKKFSGKAIGSCDGPIAICEMIAYYLLVLI